MCPDSAANQSRSGAQAVPRKARVAYILGTYPDLTTTFIDREILEARRQGLVFSLLAIRRPETAALGEDVLDLMRETRYCVPASLGQVCRAHWYFLSRHGRQYASVLGFLLTREHPSLASRINTLMHFGVGVVAADMLRSECPDHIHAHFADRAGVVAMVIHRLLDIPYSLTAHAYDIYRSALFLDAKIAGAKFATTCTAANQSHLEGVTGQRVELIYHGIDFTTVPPARRQPPPTERPLILAVGRLQEKKGFKYLVHACALLREQGIDFRCEIVGEGPERDDLAGLIGELRLEDKVVLRGALPHSAVLSRYRDATCFVLPCTIASDGDRDGIPNVILEAMAYGLPVVSTRVSGVPEVVRNLETGYLLESSDPRAIGDAIISILEDPGLAATLGCNAAEFVRREFDIRHNVVRLIELLNGASVTAAPAGVESRE